MNKQVLIKGYKLVGLFLGIAIALWFLNLDLQRTMMKLTLERQANASENVSVFFVGNKKKLFISLSPTMLMSIEQ